MLRLSSRWTCSKSKSLSSSPNGFSSSARERWRPTVPQADTERSTRDGFGRQQTVRVVQENKCSGTQARRRSFVRKDGAKRETCVSPCFVRPASSPRVETLSRCYCRTLKCFCTFMYREARRRQKNSAKRTDSKTKGGGSHSGQAQGSQSGQDSGQDFKGTKQGKIVIIFFSFFFRQSWVSVLLACLLAILFFIFLFF